ncbi:MAG TPA: hypothetical protein VIK99_01275 [Thermaerobacter sp.]
MDLNARARKLWLESRLWRWWNRREREAFLARARRLARRVDPGRTDHQVAVMALDNLETRLGRKIWPGRARRGS